MVAGGAERFEAPDFDQLVPLHWPRIYRFILASIRDSDAAQTLAQDCFVRAHRAWGGFRGTAAFAASAST